MLQMVMNDDPKGQASTSIHGECSEESSTIGSHHLESPI